MKVVCLEGRSGGVCKFCAVKCSEDYHVTGWKKSKENTLEIVSVVGYCALVFATYLLCFVAIVGCRLRY